MSSQEAIKDEPWCSAGFLPAPQPAGLCRPQDRCQPCTPACRTVPPIGSCFLQDCAAHSMGGSPVLPQLTNLKTNSKMCLVINLLDDSRALVLNAATL